MLKQLSFAVAGVSLLGASLNTLAGDQDPVYYSDCAYIEFEQIDSAQLTRAEQLAAMDADFEKSLNASEQCMDEAVSAGAGRLAQSGASGGAGQGNDSTASTEAQTTQAQEQTQQQSQQQAAADPSKTHQGGQSGPGSSAVCDAVNQGLASATTDAEKQHFEALQTEYGCS